MLQRIKRRPILWCVVGIVLVLVVLLAIGLWWWLRDDAPARVDLGAAVSTLEDDVVEATATPSAAPTAIPITPDVVAEPTRAPTPAAAQTAAEPEAQPAEGVAAEGVEGEWVINTSAAEFDYDESSGTFVGFRVEEELASIGSTTAVGRTPLVGGSLTIDGETVTSVTVEADMTGIITDDSRRDRAIQSALSTGSFPMAIFTLTEPIDLGDDPGSGPITTTAIGELTVKDITRTVEIALEAQLVDDTVVVVGSAEVVFADYEVTVPRVPIVLSAEDHGTVELQLFFTRSP
ncbi:MAG: YceI family protein [Acidimicrobiia bacterium]|nr:YceI family protein [bacterium]MXW57820.1 YceI family protein [Acidimicrobiia bacterium]MXZ77716.1 YceI family protein [Acidimicrobiia bacterium]MYB09573.1 YceI family protein [Acidimicrobiia bacterium]MYB75236.1 YceI family protein [Acidimicrobiia bacterium]